MVVIYAEKPDMAMKIAVALNDGIVIGSGRKVKYSEIDAYSKEIKALASGKGYYDITFKGEEAKVTWGYGHLCKLKEWADYNSDYKNWDKIPECFIPSKTELKLNENPKATYVKKQAKVVIDLFKKADWLINATDYDREGEVIFGYIYEYSKCKKPFKRSHFTSQTKEGINEGFDNLKTSSEIKNSEMAGRARGYADQLIGNNLTVRTQLSFNTDKKSVLSVGRVQTTVLNMIVAKQEAIEKFVPVSFWGLKAEFETDKKEKYKGEYKVPRFSKKEDVDVILSKIKGKKGKITNIKTSKTKRSVPMLYSLASLQMEANDLYGFSASETLKNAQSLYDKGLTTYPRTKSQYLNDDMKPKVDEILYKLEKNSNFSKWLLGVPHTINNKYFNSAKVDSHFAIIPTGKSPTSTITTNEEKIYNLIAKSVIRMIYSDADIDKTEVTTTVEGEDFISKGSTVINAGWLVVDGKIKEEKIPLLKNGENVKGDYEIKEGKTEPPKFYNDKSILSAMISAGKDLEDAELRKILEDTSVQGIGTEATRANIIETLIKRNYVYRDKKAIKATQRGVDFINIFPIDDLKSPEITALWEKRLQNIEKGVEKYEDFINDINEITKKWCKLLNTTSAKKVISVKTGGTIIKCPCCGKNLIKQKWGWSCSGYKEGCKFTINKTICGKNLTDSIVKELVEKGILSKQVKFISKAGKNFYAKLKLNEDKKIEFVFAERK